MDPLTPDPGPRAATVARIHLDENAGHAIVQLDDGSQFELAHDAPELGRLAVGAEVGAAARDALESAATRKKLARSVFALLGRRALTRARLRERLARDCEDHDAIDAVLDQFQARGLIDDRRFAELFLEDQLRARAIGPLSLLQRMAQQGVPRALAEDVVRENVDFEREAGLARRALAKRRRANGDPAREHARHQRFLRSRGFGGRAIAAALREVEGDVER